MEILHQCFKKNTKKKSSSPSIPSTDVEHVEADEEHVGSGSGSTLGPSLIPSPPPPIYDPDRFPQDPIERLPIVSYPINNQDDVRRSYILKGPFKPYAHELKRKIKVTLEIGHLMLYGFINIFSAHLMITIFWYTNNLSLCLQRREQDIIITC
jgi:hypothetical protein